MKRLLSKEEREVLEQLASSHSLMGFDFDGTLAPIVEERGHAGMRNRTLALFTELCELYPCAVISGRSRADVQARLAGARVKYVVGNHGLERGTNLSSFATDMACAREALALRLRGTDGVEIEDKRYSLAIHYRRARNKRDTRFVILAAIEALPVPTRTVPGKLVLNVVPRGAPNKGEALISLRAEEGASSTLYAGDDVTDEDVFELDETEGICSVRVGQSKNSAARYFLRDQKEVDILLKTLIALRVEHSARRRLGG